MRWMTILLAATAATLSFGLLVGSAAGESGVVPNYASYVPEFERDVGVTTSTAPPAAVAGDYALLSSLVVNYGDEAATVTFTDTVPEGLTVNSATAGSGSCNTAGQTVSCRIWIDPVDSAPVNVVVTPVAAGRYLNKVSILAGEGQRDAEPRNDSASATLTVADAAAPLSRPCRIPSLRRTPLGIARRVLGLLQCKPGTVKRAHSRAVARGRVIRTTPKPGTYAQGRVVGLIVSSGPANRKRPGR